MGKAHRQENQKRCGQQRDEEHVQTHQQRKERKAEKQHDVILPIVLSDRFRITMLDLDQTVQQQS